MKTKPIAITALAGACVLSVLLASCSRETPQGKNLIRNGGFEDVSNGIPKHWVVKNFRGIEGMKEATYRVNERQVYEGKNSFSFVAEEDTRRFFMLSQEIEVKGVKSIRVRARIKTVGVQSAEQQYPQAGVALTFYNKFRGRFNSQRFADVRTEPLIGSSDGWVQVEEIYRLPEETAFIEVHCVLGMAGRIWFDNVEIDVPEVPPWKEVSGPNFTHYWLDERPYPEGSLEFQDKLYLSYAARLGIPEEDRKPISYYLYPDSAAMHDMIGVDQPIKVDYPRREIHSIHPADDHEIIHLLTSVYGELPVLLGEGTAFYLMDDLFGKPVQPQAQKLLLEGKLPALKDMIGPHVIATLDPHVSAPAAASFVGFLLEFGGPERFKKLHELCNGDMAYDAFATAFEEAYGGSLKEAEKVWHAKLASADFTRDPADDR